MADKIFNLTNGVSFGARYTVLDTDQDITGVEEVLHLTITNEATSAGEIAVSVRGEAPVPIIVDVDTPTKITFTISAPCTSSGDLGIKLSDALGYINVAILDTDNTPTKVADKIRASILFTGWTIAGIDANVIFTSDINGPTTGTAGLQVNSTGIDVTAGGITYPAIGTLADDTPTKVAIKIAAGTFPNWTVTRSNAIVIFTADAIGAQTGANAIGVVETGVVGAFTIDTLGVDHSNGSITFIFKSPDKEIPVPYPLVGHFLITSAAGVNIELSDAVITYPANGTIKIESGASTFTVTADQIISLVAQRADITSA